MFCVPGTEQVFCLRHNPAKSQKETSISIGSPSAYFTNDCQSAYNQDSVRSTDQYSLSLVGRLLGNLS